MDRLTIVGVGYRNWAKKLFNDLEQDQKIDLIQAHSPNVDLEVLLAAVKPDLILFYGWSWIISTKIIDSYRCFCLHPSPLPRYRGGSPIQNQIVDGQFESAVTIFQMVQKLDAGPIYWQKRLILGGYISDIYDRMYQLGLEGTQAIIQKLRRNCLDCYDQDEEQATYCRRRQSSASEINPEAFRTQTAQALCNKIQMLTGPYPHAYISCGDGQKLYLTRASLSPDTE